MNAREVEKLILDQGWLLVRETAGSHKIYKKPGVTYLITIPFHGKKDLKPGTLNQILKTSGLK